MQEQVYSFKDCLLLNPLSSLPLPGTVSTVSVAFMCCSVPLFMFLDNWWQGRWGVGLDSLQREVLAKHSDSVIYQQCAGTYSSYSDPDYSTQPVRHISPVSAHIHRYLLRTLWAVFILPGVLVPQCTQESWSSGPQPGLKTQGILPPPGEKY